MNRLSAILLAGIFLLLTGTGYATNITIKDLNSSSLQSSQWYNSSNSWYGEQEDREVEPGMVYNQEWDLEGFFTEGTTLSLVGGYDFKKGLEDYNSGDIFIDVTNDAVYGGSGETSSNGNKKVNNEYGYDYVLDLDWNDNTYDVYAIDKTTQVLTAYYHQNQGSSPWQFNVSDNTDNNNQLINGVQLISSNSTINYYTGLTDAATGFTGDTINKPGSHNKLVVDLGFLLSAFSEQASVNFTAHYTMGCGNDNIMGKGVIPNPEPATLLLFGFGLIGIAGLCRKKW